MKTALVTTCWLDTGEYLQKTIKWVNYYTLHKAKIDSSIDIYLLDNASSQYRTDLLYKNTIGLIYRIPFREHFTRASHLDYKYYWRAIWYYQQLFQMGYDKVIALDNDFFAVSDKMFDFLKTAIGWTTPYCPRHRFPETACQVITKDFGVYSNFVKDKPFDFYNGQRCEDILPLTRVEKDLAGDRYSETREVVQNDETMDFMAQTLPATQVIYGLKKT